MDNKLVYLLCEYYVNINQPKLNTRDHKTTERFHGACGASKRWNTQARSRVSAFPDDVPSGSKLTLTDLTVSAIPVWIVLHCHSQPLAFLWQKPYVLHHSSNWHNWRHSFYSYFLCFPDWTLNRGFAMYSQESTMYTFLALFDPVWACHPAMCVQRSY